eukprot:TRINITY_DN14346_c0_g1_i1.p1 TRINITY_DN14346_c0_g1~~TRINITY_DN14346_c0_g1_i1.p1  ORF type:complete len:289 (-),score=104.36 TRINITY_DN14346_c0_g1_i1:23-808(-)
MADPFEEYEQVVESRIQNLPQEIQESVSTYFPPSIQIQHAEPTFQAEIPREFASNPTFAKDYERRRKFDAHVNEKIREIHGTMERLYFVRHDPNKPKNDAIAETKALLGELNRQNEELVQLRDKQMSTFSDSLKLDDVGITRRLSTKSFRKPSSIDISSSSSAPSEASVTRTKSTQGGLEGKTGSDKWFSLFKIFREQRAQGSIAEAQAIAERSPSEVLLEEEITKLRSAVYNLQQIKQRNAHEEQLLKIFQAKLKALHTI